jgi:hypothetical protein
MLLLVFLMMLLGLFALFLGGGLVAQGYLYQNPAERMAIRALIAALVVSGFVTFWVWVDQHAPGRYDTFFNFAPYSTVEFDEFEAIRWKGAGGQLKLDADGNPIEMPVKFRRTAGGKGAEFVEEGTNQKFQTHGSTGAVQYFTGAIRVKGPNDTEPVRYNAVLKEGTPKTSPEFASDPRRFEEQNGSRYVEAHQLGTLFIPSTRTVALALLLNLMLVTVWLVAFWLILRFSLAHAALFAGVFSLIMMLAIMPVLFKPNRQPKPPVSQPTAAITSEWSALAASASRT